jgi:hypothetical protein
MPPKPILLRFSIHDQLEPCKCVPDMALVWANIALVHLLTYRTAARGLVQACGSVDAANAYLAELVEEDPDCGGEAAVWTRGATHRLKPTRSTKIDSRRSSA